MITGTDNGLTLDFADQTPAIYNSGGNLVVCVI